MAPLQMQILLTVRFLSMLHSQVVGTPAKPWAAV